MAHITVNEAIDQALAEEMRRDPRVLMFGEGVATKRQALVNEFGASRVRNTPLAEAIIAGTAVGAAATGLRPVVDLLFAPFLCFAMDQIVNSAGKLRYISGGQFSFPLVVMTKTGSGWGVGAQHNHNLESWFVHSPGLKVVMPSTPDDFKGLLKAAIRDENPVLFFTDMVLGFQKGAVPAGDHVVPIGRARIRREGSDVTIISYAKTVHTAVEAADQLLADGIFAEVVDLRSLKPLDESGILESVRKTGRAIIVHEANRLCGVGAEVAAILGEHAFSDLRAPIVRITAPDTPAPASLPLEQAFTPQVEAIVVAARRLVPENTLLRQAARGLGFGAGAPPPARADADASPRIPSPRLTLRRCSG
jgi:acetoin:2,6-dichlorophenolindophenol oxidoreductase subunit beta